jgi:anti-anti-sigma factor
MVSGMGGVGVTVSVVVAAASVRMRVVGALDSDAAGHALRQAAIDDVGAARFLGRPLVLDLADVSFCDSAGVGTLIAIRRAYDKSAQAVTLINLVPAVLRVVEAFGLADFLDAHAAAPAHVDI